MHTCQACGQPIAPGAPRRIGLAPSGGIWAMHATLAACAAALGIPHRTERAA